MSKREKSYYSLVELLRPPFLLNGRLGLLSEADVLLVVVPVRGLEDGVLPKVVAKHLLEQADHGAKGVRHSVVLLLERDHKRVDETEIRKPNPFNFVNHLWRKHIKLSSFHLRRRSKISDFLVILGMAARQ